MPPRLANEPAQRGAVLAARAGVAAGGARYNCAHRVARNPGADRQRVRRRTEAEQDLLRTFSSQVGSRIVASHRIDLGLLPVVLIVDLERCVVGRLEAEQRRAHRQQRIAQLRAGNAKNGDVDRIDRVDPSLNEGALAPVQHLPADPDLRRLTPEVELVPGEGVTNLGPAADAPQRIVRQRRAGAILVLVLVVVEGERAGEGAEVLVADLEFAAPLRRVAGDALLVVQVAIVTVDRIGGTSRRPADDRRVRVADAPEQTIGEGIVPAPAEIAASSCDRCQRARRAKHERCEHCCRRDRGREPRPAASFSVHGSIHHRPPGAFLRAESPGLTGRFVGCNICLTLSTAHNRTLYHQGRRSPTRRGGAPARALRASRRTSRPPPTGEPLADEHRVDGDDVHQALSAIDRGEQLLRRVYRRRNAAIFSVPAR